MTAITLGAVQGITEFLPISSDGHLALASHFLGGELTLSSSLWLHLGTLCATLIFFRADLSRWWHSLFTKSLRGQTVAELTTIIAISVPTAVIGLLLKSTVEAHASDLSWVAPCLLVSAGLVLLGKLGKGERAPSARTVDLRGSSDSAPLAQGESELLAPLSIKIALAVGVIQGLAVLPGWSRSAGTIGLLIAFGIPAASAFRWSFLMSLPAVAGAVLLEAASHPPAGANVSTLLGLITSFGVGLLSLKLLAPIVAKGRFAVFAPYLVVAAAIALGGALHWI